MTAATNDLVEHGDEFRKYVIHFIESSEYGDNVGARIGVFFNQYASQEYSECLRAVRMVFHIRSSDILICKPQVRERHLESLRLRLRV